ncbi:Dihydrodipicolinate synthase [Spirochaeta thermophila DSM 6578]|uniref:4-hydroxy-tetrahydrodipicolinate synthase n=1 Tax=Winmispira thermophila (strain ATCC 700085 / DSM 6578 / Z-1203) TaxID=869211 RepID=G0GFF6_WINT7|nr:4-hydroxy-tetrahydrodipicolinate synthase [Spirochaeta thermophila]AEJ61570.1 Dihydrodipicolinate synthase [Spirochaeta thermophila DSM 6578]
MFRGVFTALITPFNKDGSVDYGALRDLVEIQIAGGVNGLVPVGTTGESPTVTHEENVKIVEVVVDQAKGRVPVIAGTGSNCTDEAIQMTKRAKEIGADATLQVAPYYNKPNQEGFYRHFVTIAETCELPVIVYNIPGRTGKNVEPETILRLAGHPLIAGVKEASGSMAQVMEIIAKRPDGFAVLSGDDNLTLPIVALGGDGVVSVASNLVPGRMSAFVKALLEGRMEEARRRHYELLPLFKAIFIDTNPIPVKYAMTLLSSLSIQEVYRLPLCPLAEDKKRLVKTVLEDLGII